jgi:hypothetical protein
MKYEEFADSTGFSYNIWVIEVSDFDLTTL